MALVGPLLLPCGIEYSIHELPKQHRAEIAAVIPGTDLTGEQVEQEKDQLLEKLNSGGHYADYFDPCSGLTMVNRASGAVYSEVDGFSTLLKYRTANAGCCKVLLHPKWGSHVYPASMVCIAPVEVAEEAIHIANQALVSS